MNKSSDKTLNSGIIFIYDPMRTNKMITGRMFMLFLIISSACGPTFKAGEKIKTGTDLTGKYWTIKNATVTGDTFILGNKNSQVVSKFKSRNFVITAKVLTVAGAEGRLDFHTSSAGTNTIEGYSVVINNTDYRRGSEQKTGSLSLIRNNYIRTASDGKWFNLKVEVAGNHISIFVDDRIISEYIQPLNPMRIEGLDGMVLSSGRVFFQKHHKMGEIFISDIQIEA